MFRFQNATSLQIMMAAILLLPAATVTADAGFFDPADDEQHLGSPDNTLFWTPEQQVAGYRNAEKIYHTRVIKAGDKPYPLPYAKTDLDGVIIQSAGVSMTVDEYFQKQKVAGLLVIRNGSIVYERYGLGNTENSRWISFSVAKSVVSMLIGAAIRDGYIGSADEKVTDYLPRLKGSSYDQSSIENLLQMASGVAWNEDYEDPESDIATAPWETLGLYEFLRHKARAAQPGEVFNYNTAETNLAGTLLRSAIGNNLSTYLSEKIWQPFGMEADAVWNLTEPGGGEFGGCCISATLRDYGRIGLFALGGGRLSDGAAVLADDWMTRSTTPSKGSESYGYFWWLGPNGVYEASGIFGQSIWVNPAENVVIAMHSARKHADRDPDWALQSAMYAALVEALSGSE